MLAGVDGAGVAAAHGDDVVGGLDGGIAKAGGGFAGDIDADLGHDGDGGGVEGCGGFAAGAANAYAPFAEMREQAGGHLRPAGVVNADEEDFGEGFAHRGYSVRVASGAGAGSRK